MASCNINELLAANPCFYNLPPNMLDVVIAQLWCEISGGVTPGGGSFDFDTEQGGLVHDDDSGGNTITINT